MPSDEYASSVRGSLKLKGATPTGITKKKKKKTSSKPVAVAEAEKQDKEKDDDEEDTSKGKKKQSRSARVDEEGADATEDLNDAELRELETRDREGDGKTASERAYEEMRRKRVCFYILLLLPYNHHSHQSTYPLLSFCSFQTLRIHISTSSKMIDRVKVE